MKPDDYIPALSYDWLTFLYDPVVRLTTREGKFKKALLEAARVRAGHTVLDLACGTGTLAILIKQAHPGAIVTGVDGDAVILKRAEKKAGQANTEIRFDEALSYELPYRDGAFDRVVSSLFFHHLTRKNKLRTLSEVKRVLKKGGELHIADWGTPHNALMKSASRGIQLLDGVDTTSDNFEGLLPLLLEQAGFENVEETGYFNSLFGTIRLHKSVNNHSN